VELYLHSQYAFIAWCSVKKSTGTTLPFTFAYTVAETVSISEARNMERR